MNRAFAKAVSIALVALAASASAVGATLSAIATQIGADVDYSVPVSWATIRNQLQSTAFTRHLWWPGILFVAACAVGSIAAIRRSNQASWPAWYFFLQSGVWLALGGFVGVYFLLSDLANGFTVSAEWLGESWPMAEASAIWAIASFILAVIASVPNTDPKSGRVELAV